MGYSRFVEVGRVAMINYGEDYGKLCVIMNVLDHNRCLVDGPTTGVPRSVMNFKRLALTGIVVPGVFGNKSHMLKKNLDKQSSDIQSQFDATAWGKKLTSKKLRSNLSDFGRFKVSIAKQKRNKLIATKLAAKVA